MVGEQGLHNVCDQFYRNKSISKHSERIHSKWNTFWHCGKDMCFYFDDQTFFFLWREISVGIKFFESFQCIKVTRIIIITPRKGNEKLRLCTEAKS